MTRLLLLLALLMPTAHAQQALTLYADRNRILLLFAPGNRDPLYQQQLELLSHHDEDLKERDVVILPILVDSPKPAAPETLHAVVGHGLSQTEQVTARRKFDVAPKTFTVVLVGKDGGEKLRSSHPVTVEKLRQVIDAMPMRQDEMRTRARPR